jgi:hypothetical protein
MAKIELDPEIAAVVYDMVEAQTRPTSGDEMMFGIRQAYFLKPILEQAFAKADVLLDDVERPEIPKLNPRTLA